MTGKKNFSGFWFRLISVPKKVIHHYKKMFEKGQTADEQKCLILIRIQHICSFTAVGNKY